MRAASQRALLCSTARCSCKLIMLLIFPRQRGPTRSRVWSSCSHSSQHQPTSWHPASAPSPQRRAVHGRSCRTARCMSAQHHVAVFGLSANPPTGLSGHAGIVQHVLPLVDEVRKPAACCVVSSPRRSGVLALPCSCGCCPSSSTPSAASRTWRLSSTACACVSWGLCRQQPRAARACACSTRSAACTRRAASEACARRACCARLTQACAAV